MDEFAHSEEARDEFVALSRDERSARARSRQASVRSDWDHERMTQLKRERASAKRALTNTVKEITAALVCHGTGERASLTHLEEKLGAVFVAFQEACSSFKSMLNDEDDIDECCAYFSDGEGRFLSTMQRLHNVGNSEIPAIHPRDSVSQTSNSKHSSVSKHSKSSSAASIKSALGKKMLHNATRKASLIAEESLLEKRQSLAYQELQLHQSREEFRLHEELVKLEAEEKVMDKIFKADGQVTPSIFDADPNVSVLVKSESHLGSAARSSPPEPAVSGVNNQQSTRSVLKTVGMVDPSCRMMRSHDSTKLVYSHGSSFARKTPPFPNPTAPNFYPSFPVPYDPTPLHRPNNVTQPHPTMPEPPMDGKQSNDCITKSSLGAERQHFSPSVPSEYGNEYLATMKKLADATMLPKSELIHFDGDPLRYYIFMRFFENQVEKDTDDNGRRLQLLIQYCSGKAKKVIESCVLLNQEEGYGKAKQLLEERFGSKYKVSNSWISKVSNGPPIRPNDREALMDLADDLQNCEITLRATGRLTQVNNEDKLVRILERCPGYVRARWQSKVQDIREDCREPNIEDVRRLVRKVAVEKNDPVFGGIMDGGIRDGGAKDRKSATSTEGNRVASQRSMNYSIQTKEAQSCGVTKAVTYGDARFKCYFCEGDHKLDACEMFKRKGGEEQLNFIRQKKLCDNCLSTTHFSAGCKKRKSCNIPGCSVRRKHISSLHEAVVAFEVKRSQQFGKTSTNQSAIHSGPGDQRQFVGTLSGTGAGYHRKSLSIVPVKIRGKGETNEVITYALLDNGSTASFCSEDLLAKLGVEAKRCQISLATISNVMENCDSAIASLEIMDLDNTVSIDVPQAFVVRKLNISKDAVATQEDVKSWPYMEDMVLPAKLEDCTVNLLIGVDVPEALQPEEIRRGENGGPFAVRTKFGWTLNGPLEQTEVAVAQCCTTNTNQTTDLLSEQLRKYFNHEFDDCISDDKKLMSANDKKSLKVFEESAKLVDGHYVLAIPWKNPQPCLPNNRSVAESRLTYLRRKLSRNNDLHVKYAEFIDDLQIKGYSRTVPKEQLRQNNGKVWYLPHHNVVNPKKPEKTRVVFDCAAKFHGKSLNEHVMQGPDLTNSLVGVLLRFRQENVALIADVEAMFHQVRVDEKDVGALRFLWFPNGDFTKEPEERQMMVHLFGGIWSPSCATFALQRTAEDNKAHFKDDVVSTVKKNFYVDDLLKSVKSSEDAVGVYKDLKKLLSLGGFNLTKWISNKREVIDAIPEEDRSKELKKIDFETDILPVERALGVQWNVANDSFQYNVNIPAREVTKRGILSFISSIYDPLGMVSPFILTAKIILQDLCRKKLGWDDAIPCAAVSRWNNWLNELPRLAKLKVPRCFKPEDFGEVATVELHHFSDASEDGFGAVSYLRTVNYEGRIQCSFAIGKSRLAPLKPMTIPRLELSAATVAVKLDRMLRRELEIQVARSVFWTDSTAVIKYISNENRRFQTFVANRIAVIRDGSDPSQWNYVQTKMNPADDASRGVPVKDLTEDSRWIIGPSFLWQSDEMWPARCTHELKIEDDDAELKKSLQSHSAVVEKSHGTSMDKLVFSKFSSWIALKKAVSWILRFKHWLILKSKVRVTVSNSVLKGKLTVEELKKAEHAIISCVQMYSYKEEIDTLKSGRKQLKKRSSLLNLDVVVMNGLLCVGGRLKHLPTEASDMKHPVILPKRNHVVDLIITYYHHLSGHLGKEYVLSLIRERFWMVNARAAVRRVISRCFKCRKHLQQPMQQKMADLPQSRITPGEPPFTYVGVDYFGPFHVKRARSRVKRYGVIFTCLVVRAVHVEVAHSLDTDSFLNALRRFMARRGRPKEIRSDNGTNFTSAENELKHLVRQWNQEKIHEFLLQHEASWHFNPPCASHMGGAWERLIRTIRRVMTMVLREQILDDEGLQTLMCEIESIVNGRPLTRVSDDPRDANALTPNHLLMLKSNESYPPGIFSKSDGYSKRRWRQIQFLADLFWKRWVREYLPTLQRRQKWLIVTVSHCWIF